jgi:hypothetical protein
MGKSRSSIPIPRRGTSVAILLGAAAVLLGLWLAGWIAFRERNPSLASSAGSWVTAAILGGSAVLWATWIGTGHIVLRGDRIMVYGRGWPVRIPVSHVNGFAVRVTRGYRGVRTEVVALDRTGFDRTVCLIPGEPERCRDLSELLGTLDSWCGIDPKVQEEERADDAVARLQEAAHRLQASNNEGSQA